MKKISYERIYQSQEYLSPLGEIHHRALFGGYTLAWMKRCSRWCLTASCTFAPVSKVQNTV